MSWPTRSLKDPSTRVSERALDDLKWRAQRRMRAAADAANAAARTVVEISFGKANTALLDCRTEEEVERVAEGFTGGMAALKGAIDGVNQ